MASEGWAVLVEGKRDAAALKGLGYLGSVVTLAAIARLGTDAFGSTRRVIILTDLDREGRTLAARYIKRLSHDGFRTSLVERKMLRIASRGSFRHIENLSKFATSEVQP